jgi:hypothetical protein
MSFEPKDLVFEVNWLRIQRGEEEESTDEMVLENRHFA